MHMVLGATNPSAVRSTISFLRCMPCGVLQSANAIHPSSLRVVHLRCKKEEMKWWCMHLSNQRFDQMRKGPLCKEDAKNGVEQGERRRELGSFSLVTSKRSVGCIFDACETWASQCTCASETWCEARGECTAGAKEKRSVQVMGLTSEM